MIIDSSKGIPIFMQIAEMIEDDILRDILQKDEQIMSTNELARVYSINPNTAAKGINELFARSIIYKKRGVGMFVAEGAKEKILEKRENQFFEAYISPMLKEAKVLGMSKGRLISIISEGEI